VFLSIWVLRIVLCVFVYMGSEECFVCSHREKNTQNNPQNPYRQKNTKQSPEPIETKTHKIILRTHREKNTQNNRVFLSLWVLGIVFCVFVSMGSEDYFVCFFLYGV
jgi:hypothetical protein